MQKIIIVDFCIGNIGSITNMLKKSGILSKITSEKKEIAQATKIILPGVGTFDQAMLNIHKLDLLNVLNMKARQEKVPILGICLGMQLFANYSTEGIQSGLGWIDGEVKKFQFNGMENKQLKVPHMGWNTVHKVKDNCLFKHMYEELRFYFVHSYHFVCNNEADVLTTTYYGYDFVSSVSHENIMGVQFHPEKSHKFGMQLLRNFVEKC